MENNGRYNLKAIVGCKRVILQESLCLGCMVFFLHTTTKQAGSGECTAKQSGGMWQRWQRERRQEEREGGEGEEPEHGGLL